MCANLFYIIEKLSFDLLNLKKQNEDENGKVQSFYNGCRASDFSKILSIE